MIDEFQPINPDDQPEIIDIEEFTRNGRIPPHDKHYKVKIGPDYYVFHKQWVTGREILEKAEYKHLECHILYLLIRGCELERIELDRRVDLAKPGIEHFVVADPEVFHYYVDDEKQETEHKELTPNQILTKADIKPIKDYYLVKLLSDGGRDSYKDRMDQPIRMVCPPAKYLAIHNGPTPVS